MACAIIIRCKLEVVIRVVPINFIPKLAHRCRPSVANESYCQQLNRIEPNRIKNGPFLTTLRRIGNRALHTYIVSTKLLEIARAHQRTYGHLLLLVLLIKSGAADVDFQFAIVTNANFDIF